MVKKRLRYDANIARAFRYGEVVVESSPKRRTSANPNVIVAEGFSN